MDFAKIDKRAIELIRSIDRYRFPDEREASAPTVKAWLVGGSVRDLLLDRPIHDYDICTSLNPDELQAQLHDFRTIDTAVVHGTITVDAWGLLCEVTSLREEGPYSDQRRPDRVRFIREVERDLARRDFTINAIAWHPDSSFIDPFYGQNDLQAALIRAVGLPENRFHEDALRILRALRFSLQLGFQIEAKTAEAMEEAAPALGRIARERILAEWRHMLTSAKFAQIWLAWPSIEAILFPELTASLNKSTESDAQQQAIRKRWLLHYDPNWPEITALAYFFRPLSELSLASQQRLLASWKFPRRSIDAVIAIWQGLSDSAFWQTFSQESFAAQMGLRRWPRIWTEMLELARVLDARDPWLAMDLSVARIAELEEETAVVLEDQQPYRLSDLAINGGDLLDLGYAAGPRIGEELNHLLDCVIEGQIEATRAALLEAALADFKND